MHDLKLEKVLALIAAMVLVSSCASPAYVETKPSSQDTPLTELYYESNLRIPLRDGVELSADLWRPPADIQYPTILVRTPYTKEAILGDLQIGEYFAHRGYAVVVQDVRGKGESGGEFADLPQESNDGYDTIEWIAEQEWSDGNVCMMGLSYLGVVQWLAAKAQPPHLKCIVPSAAPGHPFVEAPYRGGAFQVDILVWAYYNSLSGGAPEGPEPDWDSIMRHRPLNSLDERAGRKIPLFQDWVNHPTFDEYWAETTIPPEKFTDINVPALHITGWFDDSLLGTMYYWRGMQGSPAADEQYLLIGPWTHGQTFMGGKTEVHGLTVGEESMLDMREVTLSFFERYLKLDNSTPAPPKARLYITGANEWRELDEYPDQQEQPSRLYLQSARGANSLAGDGILIWKVPTERTSDSYVYDPDNPAPKFHLDSNPKEISEAEKNTLGSRQDVIIYTSEPLEEPLTVVGMVKAHLTASTDALDTDFIVRILDVDPNGVETKPYLNDGVLRTRYRNGFESTELLEPNETVELTINIQDIAHQFKEGHRIRLQLTSSVFPAVYPNSNTGNEVATDTDVKIATQTIWHGDKTYIELPIAKD